MIIGIDIRPLMDKNYSGVSEYTLNLLMALFRIDRHNKYKLFYNSYHDISERIPTFNFSNVELVKMNYPNKILNYIFFKIFHWPKIDQRLAGVDIFFMPHFNFISLSNDCQKIITIHDLSFMRHPQFFAQRQNIWHTSLGIKKLLRKVDKIIAVSENTKQDIIELCRISEKKIQVIHSGINSNYRVIEENDDKLKEVAEKYKLPNNFILYLGNLEPRKNLESLIEAYNIFRREEASDLIDPGAREALSKQKLSLVIAGAPSWKYNNIYELAKKSEYSDDIHFVNYVDAKDKVYLYNLAKIFTFPSFYEGFGFPPLEAMACGVPVITSNTSSLPEIIDTAGISIDPYNVQEIAEAIKQVAISKELREDLIASGLKKVREYNWEKCAQEVLDSFEEML